MTAVIDGDPGPILRVARKAQQIIQVIDHGATGHRDFMREQGQIFLPPVNGQQMVQVPGFLPCVNTWYAEFPGDENVIRTDIDGRNTRAIWVGASASAQPEITSTTGCTAHLLKAWDSPTPANFGGDGHGYWSAYYIDITAALGADVDIEATGSGQFFDYFFTEREIERGGGTYGDGVDVGFQQALSYPGSGVDFVEIDVSQSTKWGDLIYGFFDYAVRTFDDHDFELLFHDGEFSLDEDFGNSAPDPTKWHFSDQTADYQSHPVTIHLQDTITCISGFCGAMRGLLTGCSIRLRAHCPA